MLSIENRKSSLSIENEKSFSCYFLFAGYICQVSVKHSKLTTGDWVVELVECPTTDSMVDWVAGCLVETCNEFSFRFQCSTLARQMSIIWRTSTMNGNHQSAASHRNAVRNTSCRIQWLGSNRNSDRQDTTLQIHFICWIFDGTTHHGVSRGGRGRAMWEWENLEANGVAQVETEIVSESPCFCHCNRKIAQMNQMHKVSHLNSCTKMNWVVTVIGLVDPIWKSWLGPKKLWFQWFGSNLNNDRQDTTLQIHFIWTILGAQQMASQQGEPNKNIQCQLAMLTPTLEGLAGHQLHWPNNF